MLGEKQEGNDHQEAICIAGWLCYISDDVECGAPHSLELDEKAHPMKGKLYLLGRNS